MLRKTVFVVAVLVLLPSVAAGRIAYCNYGNVGGTASCGKTAAKQAYVIDGNLGSANIASLTVQDIRIAGTSGPVEVSVEGRRYKNAVPPWDHLGSFSTADTPVTLPIKAHLYYLRLNAASHKIDQSTISMTPGNTSYIQCRMNFDLGNPVIQRPLHPGDQEIVEIQLSTSHQAGDACPRSITYTVSTNCTAPLDCSLDNHGNHSNTYSLPPNGSATIDYIVTAPPDIQTGHYDMDVSYETHRRNKGYSFGGGFTVIELNETASPNCTPNIEVKARGTRAAPGYEARLHVTLTNKERSPCRSPKAVTYRLDCPTNWNCSDGSRIILDQNESRDVTLSFTPDDRRRPGRQLTVTAGYGNYTTQATANVRLVPPDDLVADMPSPDSSSPLTGALDFIAGILNILPF